MRKLLEDINREKIEYCILRSWKNLKSNKDVDILLKKKDIKHFTEIARKHKWKKSSGENYTISFHKDDQPAIDIHLEGLDYNNILILNGDNILENRVKRDNIYTVSDPYHIAGLILHSIVDKGYFKDRYKREIQKNWLQNKKDVQDIIKKEYSDATADKIVSLVDNKNYSELLDIKYSLIWEKSNTIEKIVLPIYWIKHQLARFPLIGNSKNNTQIISFIGVDGSGKTTAVEATQKLLQDKGYSSEKAELGVYHERSGFMKLLGRVQRTKSNENKNKKKTRDPLDTNYKRETPIRNILLLIDIKWRLMKKQIKNPSYIVTDRHFSDIFIQSNPGKITRTLVNVFNNSEYLIILYNDAEILYKRSNERTPEILEQQMKQLENNLNQANIEFTKLKTDDYEKTKKEIADIISQY